jgi:uncharacterized membrane protein YdjX (TVP38/TMEM64 family)
VPERHERSGPAWGKILLIAAVAAALAAAWRFTPLSEFLTADRVTAWARSIRELPWAPVALVLAYVPATFVLFPRPVLTILAVLAFGPWLGFAYALSGVVAAALAGYYVGRALPERTFKRIAGKKLDSMKRVLQRHGFVSVSILRILPTAPFLVESMMSGVLRIPLVAYVLGTCVGMSPGLLLETVFGDQLATALEEPSKINYWLIAAAVIVLGGVMYGVRRWAAKQQPS